MKVRFKKSYFAQMVKKNIDGNEFEVVGFYNKIESRTRDGFIDPYEEYEYKVYELKNEEGNVFNITEDLFKSVMEVVGNER